MAKLKKSTGCKLIQTFDDGTTVEWDFGEYLTNFTIETKTQRRDESTREVTTVEFRKPWVTPEPSVPEEAVSFEPGLGFIIEDVA
jgi:hypothetical protein